MHEIVTLQFGTLGNFVGGHYWNIQVRDELTQRPSETFDTKPLSKN